MAIGKEQQRLRRWFQRHAWHTMNTPTNQGFYLASPIENSAGLMERARDPKTGEVREFARERCMDIELDRFNCSYVTFKIFERKHWWKRDPSVPANSISGYNWIPSDDFEDWPRQPTASYSVPCEDALRLAELIKAAQDDWLKVRPSKNHLTFMERIAKNCPIRWIGRNSSYEEIKWVYSNERLRKERENKQYNELKA